MQLTIRTRNDQNDRPVIMLCGLVAARKGYSNIYKIAKHTSFYYNDEPKWKTK